ncbi:MAG: shikimate dehydrogenase [Pseudomonadota bacterium]|nr:shikimate dehydrogenase [Pseudomonadota bacterium]
MTVADPTAVRTAPVRPGEPEATASAKFLVGLIGEGIQGSRSPALHEQEGRRLGLSLHYQLIDVAKARRTVAELPLLLEAAQIMGFAGLNITHPFKQAVLPLLDQLSADARAIGAVNTVVFRDGKREGHNTDWSGFATPFKSKLSDVSVDRVVLMGAGGAGAAVAHAALTLGAKSLAIVDPDAAKASQLSTSLNERFGAGRASAVGDPRAAIVAANGIINATPIGMTGHPGTPFDTSWLQARQWVAEIVYFPLETALLHAARSRGCRTLDGGGMAVWQAVGAFKLFTGVDPEPARMETHFRNLVSSSTTLS